MGEKGDDLSFEEQEKKQSKKGEQIKVEDILKFLGNGRVMSAAEIQ